MSHETETPGVTDHTLAPVEHGLVRAHGFAALMGLVLSALFGLAVATKFVVPDLAGRVAELTWGRLRYAHTQGLVFGWFGNAFLCFLYYVVPRLAERGVLSARLGWLVFAVWNFVVLLPGWAAVLAGYSQPLEWAEFPLAIDVVAVVGLVLVAFQFVFPLAQGRASDLYISGWYIVGSLVFTVLAYPMGNFIPEVAPGGGGAAFSGLWTHDAVGLFVTPLALSMIYFMIPAVAGRPIYSHFISLMGFWLLLFVYPLTGMHHYLNSALPMPQQLGAVAASVLLGAAVVVVVTNLLISLRGTSVIVLQDTGLRFVWTSIICYVAVSLQGSMQALLPFNRLLHFTDWVVAHAHLALLGFASFATIGTLLHVWERTPGTRYNPRAASWAYVLLVAGLGLMFLDLTCAGLVQASDWAEGLPWMNSVVSSRPYWVVRVASGVLLVGGFLSLGLAMSSGQHAPEERGHETPPPVVPDGHPVHRHISTVAVVIFVAALVFFGLSFVALGWEPTRALAAEIASTPLPPPPTPAELRGRAAYAREGCAYCHTQQVRMTSEDEARFGEPSEPWESARDVPHLWGTRRIGPDLARETGLRSNDWQLAHLYDPRLVEPRSIMPPFPWLFSGSASKPTSEALDLVAYLQSLGRARREGLGGPNSGFPCHCRDADPHPPMFVDDGSQAQRDRGAKVFQARCVGCHGHAGRGDGPAARVLVPHPADLTAARFRPERLSEVLWNGVAGTAMPSFRELPKEDLVGLIAFVRGLGPPAEPSETPPSAVGRDVYRVRCAACHGLTGDGSGAAASLLPRRPAVFRLKQPTVARADDVLLHGVPGTGMQAMSQNMTPTQRAEVIRYARSLFCEEARCD